VHDWDIVPGGIMTTIAVAAALLLIASPSPSPTPWPKPEQMEPVGKSPAVCNAEREKLPKPTAGLKGRVVGKALEQLAQGWRNTRSRYYLSALYEHHIAYLRPGEPAAPLLALLGEPTHLPWAPLSATDYRYNSQEPPFCQPFQLMVLVDRKTRTIEAHRIN
jgi:hypothetical protein